MKQQDCAQVNDNVKDLKYIWWNNIGGEILGRVKVDLHQGDREFQAVSFSDFDVIKGLLVLRHKLDIYNDFLEQRDVISSSDWGNVKQELICLYADLDTLILKSGLTEGQKALLEMLRCGFVMQDIVDYRGIELRVLNRELNKICRRIVEYHNTQWVSHMHFTYIRTDWKTCRGCGESYPLSERFFNKNEFGKDGFRTDCVNCYNANRRIDTLVQKVVINDVEKAYSL